MIKIKQLTFSKGIPYFLRIDGEIKVICVAGKLHNFGHFQEKSCMIENEKSTELINEQLQRNRN